MKFQPGNLYHIYNRGNDRQRIFFGDDNYIYFLRKVRKYILPHCEIIAYVLMPNHFHFLIKADERTSASVESNKISGTALSNGIRILLSSYTKGINKQQGTSGNLIQQNTKTKCVLSAENPHEVCYTDTCFQYIHNNPVASGLVNDIGDWEYSSYRDYAGLRNGTLCNKTLFPQLFHQQARKISNEDMAGIF